MPHLWEYTGFVIIVINFVHYLLKEKNALIQFNFADEFLRSPEKHFGLSRKFIASLEENNGYTKQEEVISEATIEEARTLATCAYEDGTQWGEEASYMLLFSFYIEMFD